MTRRELDGVKKVHIIGIGGIGVSAIARMLHLQGKEVTGNDLHTADETHRNLLHLGIPIQIGKNPELIPEGTELVVYSLAWQDIAPELIAFVRERGIPLFSYPEMLGVISRAMTTIAVAGTHGKTTTTAMIAKVMRDGGLDPTVIVGSLLKDEHLGPAHGTNFIPGASDYFLVEACEYRRSFLHLSPKYLVITNIDLDHLDYYKDLADIQSAFGELVAGLPEDGVLVCDTKHPHLAAVLEKCKAKIVDYPSVPDFGFKLKVPGEHNVMDAKAAWRIGEALGVSTEKIAHGLENFVGTWRRFDFRGETSGGVLVYDDYAHNPPKVRAAIAGARELYPEREITVVFQPHLYSRTKTLFKEFSESFSDADHVIIAPIYASREAYDPTITSAMLVEEARKHHEDVLFLDNFQKIETHIFGHMKKGDVLMTIGAGDITKLAESVVEK